MREWRNRSCLASLGMLAYQDRIHCTSLHSTASIMRYTHLASPSQGRTIIGLNLFDSGEVLLSIGRSLLNLANFLVQPQDKILDRLRMWGISTQDVLDIAKTLTRGEVWRSEVVDQYILVGPCDFLSIECIFIHQNMSIREQTRQQARGFICFLRAWEPGGH